MAIKKDITKTNESTKILELNSLLKIVSILFILSLTVLTVYYISGEKRGKMADQNLIVVSGHGEMNVKPDTTKFTISVTESGRDVKSSQEATTNKINAAIVILKQNGVLDKNIKTLNFNTYPKYSSKTSACATEPVVIKNKATSVSNTKGAATSTAVKSAAPVAATKVAGGKAGVTIAPVLSSVTNPSPCVERTSEIVGYETTQSIEVKITDISRNPDLAGVVVSAVGKVGVQTSEVTNFVDNLDKTKQIVRDQAIQKARVQAEDIARSLGVKLGKVTSFSENSNGGYPYPMMMSSKMAEMAETADSAVANLPVGENKITSDVNVTYSIR
jgi:uncharacterized protein YggE